MCTRYISPEVRTIEAAWHIGRHNIERLERGLWPRDVRPLYRGPFIRAGAQGLEVVVGQWGLIPPPSKGHIPTSPDGKRLNTANARAEEVHWKFSYREAWKRGQRCIILADTFVEPNWESGAHIPWRFRRRDGRPWSLAGIWSRWVDPATGEVWESYSMLTLNCDAHPLLSRMHRPEVDRKTKEPLPFERQDKRAVIPIADHEIERWLTCTPSEASHFFRLPPEEAFDAGPLQEEEVPSV